MIGTHTLAHLAEQGASPSDGFAGTGVDGVRRCVEGRVVHKHVVHAVYVAVEVAHLRQGSGYKEQSYLHHKPSDRQRELVISKTKLEITN